MTVAETKIRELLDQIEKAGDWENPMMLASPENIFTGKQYRGINRLFLRGGQWATFKQISQHGGQVKRGEKASQVMFFKLMEKAETALLPAEEKQFFPMLKVYHVFEITQTSGLDQYKKTADRVTVTNEELEQIKSKYIQQLAGFTEAAGRAYYRPAADVVNCPTIDTMKGDAEYYSTLFHELTHSTGAKHRLNRHKESTVFGSQSYAREELIAELGAMLVLENTGAHEHAAKNSLAYLKNWLQALKEHPKELMVAMNHAEKAKDFILA